MVAIRVCWAVVVFGDALTVTLPSPDPAVGTTDSAALAVEADHADGAHPDGVAVTFTTCEPPAVAKFAVDGEIANVHALFVGVGWVVEGEGDGPLHAVIATSISETARVLVRFITCGLYRVVVLCELRCDRRQDSIPIVECVGRNDESRATF